ncbi:uncharacterized protein LODBEIA_P15840 [Lodderomyces beijingensis]|uniref:Zn(2)-C6 fungal-type domain-containing protein n=1 Tax=Lodderomyces beijingensis TaxID=1775926 RepID=A0ABP0ZGR6_9ASCO
MGFPLEFDFDFDFDFDSTSELPYLSSSPSDDFMDMLQDRFAGTMAQNPSHNSSLRQLARAKQDDEIFNLYSKYNSAATSTGSNDAHKQSPTDLQTMGRISSQSDVNQRVAATSLNTTTTHHDDDFGAEDDEIKIIYASSHLNHATYDPSTLHQQIGGAHNQDMKSLANHALPPPLPPSPATTKTTRATDTTATTTAAAAAATSLDRSNIGYSHKDAAFTDVDNRIVVGSSTAFDPSSDSLTNYPIDTTHNHHHLHYQNMMHHANDTINFNYPAHVINTNHYPQQQQPQQLLHQNHHNSYHAPGSASLLSSLLSQPQSQSQSRTQTQYNFNINALSYTSSVNLVNYGNFTEGDINSLVVPILPSSINSRTSQSDGPDSHSTIPKSIDNSPSSISSLNDMVRKREKSSSKEVSSSMVHRIDPQEAAPAAISSPSVSTEKIKRRKHKNSKLGCAKCKKRRVKCSEDLPSCINCRKHKVKCSYLDYTEEQLKELREAKQQKLFLKLQNQRQKGDSSDSNEDEEEVSTTSTTVTGTSAGKVSKPRSRRQSTSMLNKAQEPLPQRLTLTKKAVSSSVIPSMVKTRTDDEFISTTTRDNLKLNRSNSSLVVFKNFSNILPTDAQSELLYPDYSMHGGSPGIESPYKVVSNPQIHGVLHMKMTFSHKRRRTINHQIEYMKRMKAIAPLVRDGTASLPQIRDLYTSWLNSFIYLGYSSALMFNCLLNLNTNYLITNCFGDSYKYYSSNGDVASIARGNELAKVRQALFVKSIKYYGEVVKRLRSMLSKNDDPDTAGSVSYILSLMSVYDPESSLNSTICFVDGLFGVLTYNVQSSATALKPPVLVPIYLKLMTNIARSIYLPGYNPTFLHELRHFLRRFGEILLPMIESARPTSNSREYLTHQFLGTKYRELYKFVNEAIDKYIPRINDNLHDMDLQRELLYEMISKWVKVFPGKFIASKKVQGPIEKVLYLFYKAFKKAFFAVCPQMKFFFLRDFDSPLMMDVFASYDDFDIYNYEIEYPSTKKFSDELYYPHVGELKYMASYLIRLTSFFQTRVGILYRLQVLDASTSKFALNEANQWRHTIHNIATVRKEFVERVGVKEIQITSFLEQHIRKSNYPQKISGYEMNADELIEISIINDGHVDLMSLQRSGLLKGDSDIRSQVAK